MGVIDELERVKVQNEQRGSRLAPGNRGQLGNKMTPQLNPVGQARERIGVGQDPQLLTGRFQLRGAPDNLFVEPSVQFGKSCGHGIESHAERVDTVPAITGFEVGAEISGSGTKDCCNELIDPWILGCFTQCGYPFVVGPVFNPTRVLAHYFLDYSILTSSFRVRDVGRRARRGPMTTSCVQSALGIAAHRI